MKNGGIEREKSDASQWCASLGPKPVESPKEEQPAPAPAWPPKWLSFLGPYSIIPPPPAPKKPKEAPDDLTPIQPHVLTRENCHSYTDITTEMEEAEYLWDGKKPEHDQDFHDYHIKQKGKNA